MSELKSVLRKLHKLAWGSHSSIEEIKGECFDVWNELIDISENQQPTIADYIKDNEADWKKCHRSMVNISELRRIARVE